MGFRRSLLVLVLLAPTLCAGSPGPQSTAVYYHPDPGHPWNQLYPLLFPSGEDTSTLLQPLDLRFLLQEEQQRKVLGALAASPFAVLRQRP